MIIKPVKGGWQVVIKSPGLPIIMVVHSDRETAGSRAMGIWDNLMQRRLSA